MRPARLSPVPRPPRPLTLPLPRSAHAQAAQAVSGPMASERLPNRPACLLVASGAAEGETREGGAGGAGGRLPRVLPPGPNLCGDENRG